METPAELRERARLFRDAAAAEEEPAKKVSLAEKAFALAQRAEAATRNLTSELAAAKAQTNRRAIGFRDKAEELRTLAEQAKFPDTRAMLLRMADTYENLAAFAEGSPAAISDSATG